MTHNQASPVALILAGGKSTRFGQEDKAYLYYKGQTLLQKLQKHLATIVDKVYISSNHEKNAIPDITTELGPLGGIESFYTKIKPNGMVLCVPVDMPKLPDVSLLLQHAKAYSAVYYNSFPFPCCLNVSSSIVLNAIKNTSNHSMKLFLQTLHATSILYPNFDGTSINTKNDWKQFLKNQ